jgi:hypothetical protein
MTQRTVVQLTDDLSGVEIPSGKGETVTFNLDGRSYEIELTIANSAASCASSVMSGPRGRRVAAGRRSAGTSA